MESRRRRGRGGGALAFLGAGCLLLLACSVVWGSVLIPLGEFGKLLTGKGMDEAYRRIVVDIRLPRAAAAFWLGGALALSGYLLQTFFHNPIAGPFVLGISSGAKLAVALVMVEVLGRSMTISSGVLIGAAFGGALVSMGVVLLMSRRVDSMALLVISGVMVGYICSAVTDFVVTFADEAEIVNLHNWSRGSFSGMAWGHVRVMAGVLSMAVAAVFFLAKPIGAYELGEEYARSVGVHVEGLRVLLVVLSSVLSACVAAFAGPVSFVGIAVPQMVKRFIGTGSPLWMIPASFLGGSMFCMGCDLIARPVFAPAELGISTVTAVFGAPVVLWVMAGRRLGWS